MKRQISPREWELLSEYLDQQLSPRKQSHLEARLAESPELRDALQDLRQTRALLRSAPRLKAPRSFKLTPSMVPERKSRPVYPVFQMASAFATILLALVLLGDLMGVGLPSTMTPQSVAVERAVEVLAVEATGEASAASDQMRAFGVDPYPAPEGAPPMPQAAVPEREVTRTPLPETDGAYAPAPTQDDAPPSILALPSEGGEAESMLQMEKAQPAAPAEAYEDLLEPPVPTQPRVSLWRTLEVLLAGIALGTGLAAFYLRRAGG